MMEGKISAAQVERTVANLQKNGFRVVRCASPEEATEFLLSEARPGQSAGSGGSLTLTQLGLLEKLEGRGVRVIRHAGPGIDPADSPRLMREELLADLYYCSANAITEQGWIFNTDGAGNRVAATVLGPPQIFIVAGINKLVTDLPEAERRLTRIAPYNCQRLHFATPCAASGVCEDCDSPDRSCRVEVIMKRPPRTVHITVVLVEAELGV